MTLFRAGKFLGLDLVTDDSMPDDEVRLIDTSGEKGKIVARFTTLGAPNNPPEKP